MVDISTNTSGSINVTASNRSSINVNSSSSSNVNTNTNANAQRAKSWAVGQGLIDGEDYSAKHYAQQAIVDVNAVIDEKLNNIQTSGNVRAVYNNGVLVIENYTYVFEQAVSSDTWTINHNLNKRPSVTIVDSSGNVFEPAVSYVDDNTCIAEMLGATTGKAYLN